MIPSMWLLGSVPQSRLVLPSGGWVEVPIHLLKSGMILRNPKIFELNDFLSRLNDTRID